MEKMLRDVQDFNLNHDWEKKGLATIPVCFGVSFEKAFLNQASALVHIYSDGSVSVSTAATEMGQGVNMKIRQVAARIFSIPLEKIKTESTNTTRVANASPTAASYSADLNGHAARLGCLNILARLKAFAAQRLDTKQPDDIEIKEGIICSKGEPTDLTWNKLISESYFNRINLSAQAHYATPGIHFHEKKNKGKPFAYHTFGAAIIETTVDCLRGTYRIDSVKVVHDFSKSLNPLIDRGQVEGGVVQGLGWMTMEEVMRNEKGYLVSGTLSSYKIPDIYSAPKEIQVSFLEGSHNPLGVFNSKGIGEPPLMYGIGAYFSLLKAMKAFRSDIKIDFSAPMTPEKVLLSLYARFTDRENM